MTGTNSEEFLAASTEPLTNAKPSNDAPKKATDMKRVLACGTCRKRKLKCDSKRPKCSTCARLGHPCEYDEVRKKSGPKRGYVKSLEARLNQLESLLDSNKDVNDALSGQTVPPKSQSKPGSNLDEIGPVPEIFPQTTMTDQDLNLISDLGLPVTDFSWDMVSLGLEEPLPSQEIMDDLYQIYFEKVHPSLPMLHRPRFLASLKFAPNSRPPVCLRYIIFAHACSTSPQYAASAEQFYQKARKYMEQDQMRGHGESFISVAHAQTWNLIGCYEFKHMYFPRAWTSVGSAGRLALMLGLHRQDRVGLDVKQTLAPAKDWIEREERRRTFWVAYCQDRYASIGTGWPMMMDENDILTTMPSSDGAFLRGVPEAAPMLSEIMRGDKTSHLSSYGSVILLATLFGRNLTHLHRPGDEDRDHDLNGEFWRRHRSLDNILLNTALSLPSHLRLPQGLSDPNIVFCNMNIHTSTICLHQAAIFKADKYKLAAQISAESKRRCLVAADQITSIMRMISHQDLSVVRTTYLDPSHEAKLAQLNPFLAFCLYVAARVFVQYLKFKRTDLTVRSSLIFLLSAMQALKEQNPLTESFLVQLDVDLEGSGLDIPSPMSGIKYAQRNPGQVPADHDAVHCLPIFEIRDEQAAYSLDSGQGASTAPAEGSSFSPTVGPADQAAVFRTGGPQAHLYGGQAFASGQSASGVSPGSSDSNHATPASSSNQRSSLTDTSSPQSNEYVTKHGLRVDATQPAPGILIRDWDMRMGADNESESQQSTDHSRSRQHSQQDLAYQQLADGQHNNIDFGTSGSGFTPDPSGFSPWTSGTGMTPMAQDWAQVDMTSMNVNMGNDGADWMSSFR